ncbi:MBL fold metallo-hydrolase [Lentisphaera profundi]|uniref:MBL fold metallo-hydrolase n=1 Tax=Lentisphaera profundi TaxID=1658616 RepID=A0ABY7VS82_9BACT|nr:MBL fold metallo-hydrolase [Lentisphaera profundi]WDE97068.1 MBL fold metallo-hydrolase [Lentisphaera profundi]
MKAKIITFPVGLYQCNCSIIYCSETKEAILIDPGSEAEVILKKINDRGLSIKAVIHTHAHLDHFGATHEVSQSTKSEVYLHKDDKQLWDIADLQAEMLGLPKCPHANIDHFIEDSQSFHFGEFKLEAIHTPGHSAGSTCFKIENGDEQLLFSGDTLFKRGVGRTDLPTGDSRVIAKSIKEKLYTLDIDTQVIPGHGPNTIIGEEKKQNPFIKA